MSMATIKDILLIDPSREPLVNNGQARLAERVRGSGAQFAQRIQPLQLGRTCATPRGGMQCHGRRYGEIIG